MGDLPPHDAPERRESAIARLRALPQTFSIEQLCLLSRLTPELARKYASRWSQAGLIRPAGPRAGYYANLVAAPQLARENGWLAAALLHTYPSATIVGASVLDPAGWVTQRPHQTHIAVLAPARRAQIDAFDVTPRSRSWFERTHPFVEKGAFGMRALRPAMALADMYARRSAWHPDPDDLEIPEGDLPEVAQAFAALETQPPEHIAAMLEGLEEARRPSQRPTG